MSNEKKKSRSTKHAPSKASALPRLEFSVLSGTEFAGCSAEELQRICVEHLQQRVHLITDNKDNVNIGLLVVPDKSISITSIDLSSNILLMSFSTMLSLLTRSSCKKLLQKMKVKEKTATKELKAFCTADVVDMYNIKVSGEAVTEALAKLDYRCEKVTPESTVMIGHSEQATKKGEYASFISLYHLLCVQPQPDLRPLIQAFIAIANSTPVTEKEKKSEKVEFSSTNANEPIQWVG